MPRLGKVNWVLKGVMLIVCTAGIETCCGLRSRTGSVANINQTMAKSTPIKIKQKLTRGLRHKALNLLGFDDDIMLC